MIDRGDNTYGGKFVVNPSGGLISKGHPLGATGMWNPLKRLLSPLPNLFKATPPLAARWQRLTVLTRLQERRPLSTQKQPFH